MKKFILFLLIGVFLSGCGTTFEQRRQIYVTIYKEVKNIVHHYGPIAGQLYLEKKVQDGTISKQEKDEIISALVTDM